MLDFAVREFLLAIVSAIIPMELSVAPGAATVRVKAARVAVDAIAAPVAYPLGAEPVPMGGIPSNSPTDDREWVIRAATGGVGYKLLRNEANFVDIRIFR